MLTYKVMVSAPYMQPVLERFRPVFEDKGIELVVPPVLERMSEQELLEWVGDIDGAITGDDAFTDRVLAAAPNLKVISKWGTGIDSIDSAACERRGVRVCNTPNAFSEPVADTVLGYMLIFARRLVEMDQDLRQGKWLKYEAHALRERTLGVIGVGNCGKAVIRRAQAFGMRLLGSDPLDVAVEFIAQTGVEMVDLDTLLGESDYISLNCTLNPSSQHIINSKTLALVKPGMVLINAARGPLVDESALIAALKERTVGGAGLDVFEDEPLAQDNPLRQFRNVMIAPHNANSSPQAWEHVHQNTIHNCFSVLFGE